jgi:hypothetical protein
MSTGRQRFRKTEAERLLRAFGHATGIPPEQAALTYNLDDGSLTVSAKTNPPAGDKPLDDGGEIVL